MIKKTSQITCWNFYDFLHALCVRKEQNTLILSFRRVLYVVCFLLGNSPASEF